MQGPRDPALREQWRLARRQAARRLHPDRGGDTDTYLAELARIDARYTKTTPQQDRGTGPGTTPGPGGGSPVVVTRTVRSRIRGRARATRRAARHLVRRVSPSRRHTEI